MFQVYDLVRHENRVYVISEIGNMWRSDDVIYVLHDFDVYTGLTETDYTYYVDEQSINRGFMLLRCIHCDHEFYREGLESGTSVHECGMYYVYNRTILKEMGI